MVDAEPLVEYQRSDIYKSMPLSTTMEKAELSMETEFRTLNYVVRCDCFHIADKLDREEGFCMRE